MPRGKRAHLGIPPSVVVDDSDRALLEKWSWTLTPTAVKGYRRNPETGKDEWVLMHRLIMGAVAGEIVDHKNQNPYDNRRANLRFASKSQNGANCKRRKHSSSPYKGVRKARSKAERWVAYISVKGRQLHLGSFPTQVDAAHAYDAAALRHYGEFAYLNFPSWLK